MSDLEFRFRVLRVQVLMVWGLGVRARGLWPRVCVYRVYRVQGLSLLLGLGGIGCPIELEERYVIVREGGTTSRSTETFGLNPTP